MRLEKRVRRVRLLPGSAAVGPSRPIASSIWTLRGLAPRESKTANLLLGSLLGSIKLRFAVCWCEEWFSLTYAPKMLLRFLMSSVLYLSLVGFFPPCYFVMLINIV